MRDPDFLVFRLASQNEAKIDKKQDYLLSLQRITSMREKEGSAATPV
jgi:hypothetical protein